MATIPSNPVSGSVITVAGFGAPVVAALQEHENELNDPSTGNPALGTRVSALETTVNATGTTAAGNAALSSRLGTGVTTASTATAQLALKAPTSRLITAGTGLTGGGDLSADRTLTVAYGNTATTAATGLRATNLEAITTTWGRWYSTSTATITAEVALSSWVAAAGTPSGITVSGTTFTIANAGTYEITCGQFSNVLGTLPQTGMIGFSIRPTSGSLIYGYNMVPYNATATAASTLANVVSGPISVTAGTTFIINMYCSNANGVQMAGTAANQGTFCSINRIN